MSDFIPEKRLLREVLLFLFNIKRTSAESCRLIVECYGHNAPSKRTCRQLFRRFKNDNFDFEDKKREGAPKRFEDEEFEAILNEDPCKMKRN